MLNVLEKCDALEKAMQLSVHNQHDAVVKITRKEFSSRYAKFVYYYNRVCESVK